MKKKRSDEGAGLELYMGFERYRSGPLRLCVGGVRGEGNLLFSCVWVPLVCVLLGSGTCNLGLHQKVLTAWIYMAVDHDGNRKKGGVDMAVADWLQASMQIDVSTSHLN